MRNASIGLYTGMLGHELVVLFGMVEESLRGRYTLLEEVRF